MQVPPSAGRTPVRRADAGSGEPTLAEPGSADHDGNHRGRDHHSRPHFDEESRAETRSRDAPDEEGQPVVLRHEGARGGGQQDQADSQCAGDTRQCGGCDRAAGVAARGGARVWGDQAYRGQADVIHASAPRAQDCTHRRYRYKDQIDEVERAKNRTKSTVRSKVEHVFGVMKLKFGFVKVRYRGLVKNANRLFATCALVNLFMVRKKLMGTAA